MARMKEIFTQEREKVSHLDEHVDDEFHYEKTQKQISNLKTDKPNGKESQNHEVHIQK